MSLEHHRNERSRTKRGTRTLLRSFATDHPDQVLTFLEWCQFNRISERNGRRDSRERSWSGSCAVEPEADRHHHPCQSGMAGSAIARRAGAMMTPAFAKTVAVVARHLRPAQTLFRTRVEPRPPRLRGV